MVRMPVADIRDTANPQEYGHYELLKGLCEYVNKNYARTLLRSLTA